MEQPSHLPPQPHCPDVTYAFYRWLSCGPTGYLFALSRLHWHAEGASGNPPPALNLPSLQKIEHVPFQRHPIWEDNAFVREPAQLGSE